jgi:hypothetical protein
MSHRTIYLGKLTGLYCLILALAMMSHKQASVDTITALVHDAPLLLFVSVLTLVAGLHRSGAQGLVRQRAPGYRHSGRLDRADQRADLPASAAPSCARVFRSMSIRPAFLRVHEHHSRHRHLFDVFLLPLFDLTPNDLPKTDVFGLNGAGVST